MLTCLYATSPNAAIPGNHQFSSISLGWCKGQWTDCGAVRTTENGKTHSQNPKLFQSPLECHGPWAKLWFPKSLYFDRRPRRISLPASKLRCSDFRMELSVFSSLPRRKDAQILFQPSNLAENWHICSADHGIAALSGKVGPLTLEQPEECFECLKTALTWCNVLYLKNGW